MPLQNKIQKVITVQNPSLLGLKVFKKFFGLAIEECRRGAVAISIILVPNRSMTVSGRGRNKLGTVLTSPFTVMLHSFKSSLFTEVVQFKNSNVELTDRLQF